MGGEVAWRYALSHADRLRGLVLVDAAGWPEPRGPGGAAAFKLLRSPLGRAVLTHIDLRALARQGLEAAFVDPRLVTGALVSRYVDFARAPGHRQILIGMGSGPEDAASPERLGRIRTPTLVMVGGKDRLIPPGDAEKFRRAIPSAELARFPDAGHVPMETVPDASAEALERFADRLPSGAPTRTERSAGPAGP
jgi:pimeloyl-ACP methyl ester carboxylesterase